MPQPTTEKMRLGILGGTFNPIHIGHLAIAENVREQYALHKVLFIPSARPPHKDQRHIIDPRHRLHFVRLAIADNPFFELSDIEVKREGRSYSVETLKLIRQTQTHPADYFFIIGADSLPELKTWKNIEELASLCTFVVVPRPGWDIHQMSPQDLALPRSLYQALLSNVASSPLIGISSTQIRDRIKAGKSIRYLVPGPVREYIQKQNLYRAAGEPT